MNTRSISKQGWQSPILLLLLALSTVPGMAQDWLFTEGEARAYPRLRTGAGGVFVLTYCVVRGQQTDVYVTHSNDDGVTWSEKSLAATVRSGTIGLQRQPQTILDNQGILHLAFEDFRSGSTSIDAWYCRSTDMGATWSEPQRLGLPSYRNFVSIAADSVGHVYVSYLGNSPLGLPTEARVQIFVSSDRGSTWNLPVVVDNIAGGIACECCQQSVDVAPNGTVAVAYRANVSNIRDIHVVRSTDFGQTWLPAIKVQSGQWSIDGCPSTGPKISHDESGATHVVWRDARDSVGRNVVWYAKLPANSTEVPHNVDLSSARAESADYPDLAVTKDGKTVCVVFESGTGLQTAITSDSGQSFTVRTLDEFVRNSVWASAALQQSDNTPFYVWQATRDGRYDLRYDDGSILSVPSQASVRVQMVMTSNGLVVDADEEITISIADQLGRLILRQHVHPGRSVVSALLRGVYFVSVRSALGKVTTGSIQVP